MDWKQGPTGTYTLVDTDGTQLARYWDTGRYLAGESLVSRHDATLSVLCAYTHDSIRFSIQRWLEGYG